MSAATIANKSTSFADAPLYRYRIRHGRCIDCGERIAGTINAKRCPRCHGRRMRGRARISLGHYCEWCRHFYPGESRCPRHG